MHVRKGDTVVVISGNDKGKQGTIQSVFRERSRVIVEGINLRWKHKKASQSNPKGERVQRECSIHSSNVMLLDSKTDKPTRQRSRAERAGGKGKTAKKTTKKEAAAS